MINSSNVYSPHEQPDHKNKQSSNNNVQANVAGTRARGVAVVDEGHVIEPFLRRPAWWPQHRQHARAWSASEAMDSPDNNSDNNNSDDDDAHGSVARLLTESVLGDADVLTPPTIWVARAAWALRPDEERVEDDHSSDNNDDDGESDNVAPWGREGEEAAMAVPDALVDAFAGMPTEDDDLKQPCAYQLPGVCRVCMCLAHGCLRVSVRPRLVRVVVCWLSVHLTWAPETHHSGWVCAQRWHWRWGRRAGRGCV
jgi:hypothetical protein